MYNETGRKIQNSATNSAMYGVMGSIVLGILIVVAGLIIATEYGENIILIAFIVGLFVAIKGSISAWRKHLLMAGFGELIEQNSQILAELSALRAEMQQSNTSSGNACSESDSVSYFV